MASWYNLGVALLPRINVADELQLGVLLEAALSVDPVISLPHGLIFLQGREQRAAARAFAEHAKQHFAAARS